MIARVGTNMYGHCSVLAFKQQDRVIMEVKFLKYEIEIKYFYLF